MLVAAGGAGVVLIRVPVRQTIALSAYGLLLAMMFLAFQAPDVTLSELAVGAVALPVLVLLTLAKVTSGRNETPAAPVDFLGAIAGLAAFYLWGLKGLPGFGSYPGPYGLIINRIAVAQTNATGVVSAVNFEYRGFDTVGEEFILFVAATGVGLCSGTCAASGRNPAPRRQRSRARPATRTRSGRLAPAVLRSGARYRLVPGLARPDQPIGRVPGRGGACERVRADLPGRGVLPSGGSARRPLDAVEAAGAGGFAGVGFRPVILGLPYLANFLPLGTTAGKVSSSGTIALISFFVGIEVAAAFILIIGELLEQTLLVRQDN